MLEKSEAGTGAHIKEEEFCFLAVLPKRTELNQFYFALEWSPGHTHQGLVENFPKM